MEYSEHVAAFRRDAAAATDAARRARIDAAVPSCPDWTVRDLLEHVGRLHRWVTDVVVHQPDDVMRGWNVAFPAGDAIVDFFAEGAQQLADALSNVAPETPVWSWTDDHTARFWARRQANELAVHRYDAQLAAGAPAPVAADLAADGIDEFFALVPFWRGAANVRGNGETLHFHCTDVEGEWLARLDPDGLVVTREHAKGDVAARGAASDLLLFVYGRVDADALDVFGDASLLARWRDLVSW